MNDRNDGGPAFPTAFDNNGERLCISGMSLRDYFAIHAPEPTEEEVSSLRQQDKTRNPYNDSHLPPLRTDKEIRSALRYKYADAMLKAKEGNR